jgi:Aminotransferase class I and II
MSAKLARVNGLDVPPERIVATNGALSGLFTTCLALLAPGDEMLMPDPGWPNWEQMILTAGGRVVRYPTAQRNGFLPHVPTLGALVTGRTRAIIVNSPLNPTGGGYRGADRFCPAPRPVGGFGRMLCQHRRRDLLQIAEGRTAVAADLANAAPGRGRDVVAAHCLRPPVRQRVLQRPKAPLISGRHQPARIRSQGGLVRSVTGTKPLQVQTPQLCAMLQPPRCRAAARSRPRNQRPTGIARRAAGGAGGNTAGAAQLLRYRHARAQRRRCAPPRAFERHIW